MRHVPFRVQAAAKQAGGTYTTSSISVSKDGRRPFWADQTTDCEHRLLTRQACH
jgi:hypothetical protein